MQIRKAQVRTSRKDEYQGKEQSYNFTRKDGSKQVIFICMCEQSGLTISILSIYFGSQAMFVLSVRVSLSSSVQPNRFSQTQNA